MGQAEYERCVREGGRTGSKTVDGKYVAFCMDKMGRTYYGRRKARQVRRLIEKGYVPAPPARSPLGAPPQVAPTPSITGGKTG